MQQQGWQQGAGCCQPSTSHGPTAAPPPPHHRTLSTHCLPCGMAGSSTAYCRSTGFSVIGEAYDRFLKWMGDPVFRGALVSHAPGDLDAMNRTSLPEYDLIHANSSKLISELVRFTLARQKDWSQGFFEYLLF